ncbi:E3 ubiquitin-protein ligase TRIM36-like [Saccostrea cucullata]|uniref:E3 ubiquitin-protein ligase TRIM36-like n=1 Tax=Saccostrea cuccullata TaxID=36930 RepID=UPI002ED0C407
MDPYIRAQDPIPCDLCETEMVQVHCEMCNIKLCNTCIGEHMASDDTKKKHEILRFIFRKSFLFYPICSCYDKEQCEMYCKQCNVHVCLTCIASDQHSGHTLLKILQVFEERKEKITKELNELNKTIFPTYQDISSDVQNAIKQLEKKYGDLTIAIRKHGDHWHQNIDNFIQKLKAELDEMKNNQILTLQKHLDDVNEKLSEIRDEINSTDMVIDSQDISEMLCVTLNVNKYMKLPQKIVPSIPTFNPSTVQEEELFCLFGSLSPGTLISEEQGYQIKTASKKSEAGTSHPDKQLLDEPELSTIIFTRYRTHLNNVVCLNDEEIWTRGNEKTMNLFSINEGLVLKSIQAKSGNAPTDIAVTKDGHLVYVDYKQKSVHIVRKEEMETVIKLKKWRPRNLCMSSSGDFLVAMHSNDFKQSKVVRYTDSMEKQTIQFDDDGKPLFSSEDPKYISENRNMDICVADYAFKVVVVVTDAGNLRIRYTGHTPAPRKKIFKPAGITTDSQSHILISDIKKSLCSYYRSG